MSNYSDFYDFIDKDQVQTIFELGSRDCLDAIDLSKYFNCLVYAFECNPDGIKLCKENLINYDRVKLIELAVSDQNGEIIFRPFDVNRYNNIGASSIFKIDFSNRPEYDPDFQRGEVQNEIKVTSTTLDNFIFKNKINKVDLLCIDLQGAEYLALKGCEQNLKNVKYIIVESSIKSTYKGGSNFFEVEEYLKKFNFNYVFSNKFAYDYPNKNILSLCEFDSIFINKEIK